MHAREIVVVLLLILIMVIGWTRVGKGSSAPASVSMFTNMEQSSESFSVDPIVQQNTSMNKVIPVVMDTPVRARTRKHVSFAPQKEVAEYSKSSGYIGNTTHVRL